MTPPRAWFVKQAAALFCVVAVLLPAVGALALTPRAGSGESQARLRLRLMLCGIPLPPPSPGSEGAARHPQTFASCAVCQMAQATGALELDQPWAAQPPVVSEPRESQDTGSPPSLAERRTDRARAPPVASPA